MYNVQNLDFNLSQFALFLDNDTIFVTVHINDSIKLLGRKPLSGDVIELPHLRDEFALNDLDFSLPRFYVISDVTRASEGFGMTWYPHLYRLKLTKLNAQQQYADILNKPADENLNFVGDYSPTTQYNPGDIVRFNGVLYTTTDSSLGNLPTDTNFFSVFTGTTLLSALSNNSKMLEINDLIIDQAESDTRMSGYETRHFYTLTVDEEGRPRLETIDQDNPLVSNNTNIINASRVLETPQRDGYTGYLLGDGFPTNGSPFGSGTSFPASPIQDDYFLRTDYQPNRLFKYDGTRWVKREDNVRHTLTNTENRQTQKMTFINNLNNTVLGADTIPERQSLSKVLRPKADF